MIFARNEIVIGSAYSSTGTFKLGEGEAIEKLDIHVFDNPIIIQPSEDFPVTFTDATDWEVELYKGFSSRVPVTPWTGFKIRSLGASSRVTFVGYA